jgi:diamine N-acetyltransferase
MQLMTLPRGSSSQRVDEWLAKWSTDSNSLFLIIADKEQDRAVGYVQLKDMDFVHGHGELGICLEEPAQGRGYAAEALRLLEEHARCIFNIRKIVLRVLASHGRAIRFYEKMGYTAVGTLKEHFYQKRAYHDVLIMEKLLR